MTSLERRDETSSAICGNALDYSDGKAGYVKGVSQEGSLEAGYALLKVETVKGTDLCFAAYRPGMYRAGGLGRRSCAANRAWPMLRDFPMGPMWWETHRRVTRPSR